MVAVNSTNSIQFFVNVYRLGGGTWTEEKVQVPFQEEIHPYLKTVYYSKLEKAMLAVAFDNVDTDIIYISKSSDGITWNEETTYIITSEAAFNPAWAKNIEILETDTSNEYLLRCFTESSNPTPKVYLLKTCASIPDYINDFVEPGSDSPYNPNNDLAQSAQICLDVDNNTDAVWDLTLPIPFDANPFGNITSIRAERQETQDVLFVVWNGNRSDLWATIYFWTPSGGTQTARRAAEDTQGTETGQYYWINNEATSILQLFKDAENKGETVCLWLEADTTTVDTGPQPGEIIQAIKVFQSQDVYSRSGENGTIADGGNGKLILITNSTAGTNAKITTDYGDTWQDVTLPTASLGSNVTDIKYHQPTDTWTLVRGNFGGRQMNQFVSRNDGLTWTEFTANKGMSSYGFVADIDDQGRAWTASRAGGNSSPGIYIEGVGKSSTFGSGLLSLQYLINLKGFYGIYDWSWDGSFTTTGLNANSVDRPFFYKLLYKTSDLQKVYSPNKGVVINGLRAGVSV